jgi:hypothetical protein
MHTIRNLSTLGVLLYGATFLWLAAGPASPAHVQGATFAMAQALVILTVVSFWVAAWGVFKATAWWEAFAVGGASIGLAALVPSAIVASSANAATTASTSGFTSPSTSYS